MTMTINTQTAPTNALGFDCNTVLNASTAQAFVTAGFTFAVRYLSLTPSIRPGDLTLSEVETILQSGLALMAVQHVLYAGWSPTQQLGFQNGNSAAACAQAAGLPAGINVWLDLEGINPNAQASDVIAYCNAWFSVVDAAGYVSGLYVGANCILTGDQLFNDLNVSAYWRSGSTVPMVPNRGYCMVQTISNSYRVAGVAYDQDVIQADNNGNTPTWAIAA